MILFLVAIDTLDVGDILDIRFLGYDYSAQATVERDSTILLQPFGYIKVAGLDIFSAQDTIFNRIKDYYPSAIVSITIKNRLEPVIYIATSRGENAFVPYRKGITLRDAILLTGNISYKDITKVELYRDSIRISMDRNASYPLKPGDLLFVHMRRGINWQLVWTAVNTLTSLITLLTVVGVIGR